MGAREDALAKLAAMGGKDTGTTVPAAYAQLTDAQMVTPTRRGPRMQGTLEELAAAKRAQAEPSGLAGIAYDMNKNIVGKVALKGLGLLGAGMSSVVSAVNEGADLLGEAASGLGLDRWDTVQVNEFGDQMPEADKFDGWTDKEKNAYNMARNQLGNRDASLSDLVEQARNYVGFGDVIQNTTPNAPHAVKVVGGIIGDIALDPLTWVAPSGKAVLKIGGEGAEAATKFGLQEAYRSGARNTMAEALSQTAKEVGLHTDEGVQRLIKGVTTQGRGGLTDAAIRAAGVSPETLGKLGIEDVARQFGKKVVWSNKATKGLTNVVEGSKGAVKAALGNSAVGKYGRAVRMGNQAMQRNLTDVMRNLGNEPAKVMEAALASGLAKRARGGASRWGADWLHTAAKRFKAVPEFKNLSVDARRQITHDIEAAVASGKPTEEVVRLLDEVAKSMADMGIPIRQTYGAKYVPHISTRQARKEMAGNEQLRIFMSGLDDTAFFLQARADNRTIKQINDEAVARFGFKVLEDDITDIVAIFMGSAEKQVERHMVSQGLQEAGLMVDNEFRQLLSPEQELLRKDLLDAVDGLRDQSRVALRNGVRIRRDALNDAVAKIGGERKRSMRELAKAQKALQEAEHKAGEIARRVDTLSNSTIPALEQEIVRLEAAVKAAKASQKRSLSAKLGRAKTTLKQAQDEQAALLKKYAKAPDVAKLQAKVADAVAKRQAAEAEAMALFPDAVAKPQAVAAEPSVAQVAPEPPAPAPVAAAAAAVKSGPPVDGFDARLAKLKAEPRQRSLVEKMEPDIWSPDPQVRRAAIQRQGVADGELIVKRHMDDLKAADKRNKVVRSKSEYDALAQARRDEMATALDTAVTRWESVVDDVLYGTDNSAARRNAALGGTPEPAAAPEPVAALDPQVVAAHQAKAAELDTVRVQAAENLQMAEADLKETVDSWAADIDSWKQQRDALEAQFIKENNAPQVDPAVAAEFAADDARIAELDDLLAKTDDEIEKASELGDLDMIDQLEDVRGKLLDELTALEAKDRSAIPSASPYAGMPEFKDAAEARAWAAANVPKPSNDAAKVVEELKARILAERNAMNAPTPKLKPNERQAFQNSQRKLIAELEKELDAALSAARKATNDYAMALAAKESDAIANIGGAAAKSNAEAAIAKAKFMPTAKKKLTPEQVAKLAELDAKIAAEKPLLKDAEKSLSAQVKEAKKALADAEAATKAHAKAAPKPPKAPKPKAPVAPKPKAAPAPMVEPPKVQMVVDPAEQAAVEQARAKYLSKFDTAVERAQQALDGANNGSLLGQQEVAEAAARVSKAEIGLAGIEADLDKLAQAGAKQFLPKDETQYLKWLNDTADKARKNLQKDATNLATETTLIADSTKMRGTLQSVIDQFNTAGTGLNKRYTKADRAIMSDHINETVRRIDQLSDPQVRAELGPVADLLALQEQQALMWDIIGGNADMSAKQIEDMLHTMSLPNFGDVIEYATKAKQGWALVGEKHQVPNWLNDAMSAQIKLQDPEVWGKYVDGMKRVQNLWKGMATSRPGFVIRNAISSTFSMYLEAGAKSLRYLDDFAKFVNIRRQHPENYLEVAANRGLKDLDLMDEAFTAVTGSGSGQVVSEFATELARKSAKVNVFNKEHFWYRGIRATNEMTESTIRGAHALAVLKRGGTMEQAMDVVNKWHFNYRDLSTFNRRAKNVIPFWSFFSNNIALQAHIYTHELPKLSRTVMNLKRNTEDENGQGGLPDYLQGQFMFGAYGDPKGEQKLYDAGLPSMQIISDFGTAQRSPLAMLGSVVSPFISVPAQALFNRDTFTGREFDSAGEFLTDKVVPSFLPPVGTGQRMADPDKTSDALMSFITGIGARTVTPENRYWAQKRAYEEALADARRKAMGG